MPNQRKTGKKFWGGYIPSEIHDKLDRETEKVPGIVGRGEFLVWLADADFVEIAKTVNLNRNRKAIAAAEGDIERPRRGRPPKKKQDGS